ncbi:MAG: chromate transporter [Bryobacteraceae bacterium]|nr:chromate transporter [Bryobacteraceae bacterium]
MNLWLLYLVMLKATATTLNGPMSLPILRDELVVKNHVLTDRELSAAVTAAQAAPGPMGIYIVGVGYFVAGPAGAAVGWLAMLTPALIAVPLARIGIRWLTNQRARRAMDAAVLASAGLIAMSAIPLAQASIRDNIHYLLAVAAFFIGVRTRVPTALIIASAGIIGVLSSILPTP